MAVEEEEVELAVAQTTFEAAVAVVVGTHMAVVEDSRDEVGVEEEGEVGEDEDDTKI